MKENKFDYDYNFIDRSTKIIEESFENKDYEKIKNNIIESIDGLIESASKSFNGFINKKSNSKVIPVKNQNIVEQKPSDEKLAKQIMGWSKTVMLVTGIISFGSLIDLEIINFLGAFAIFILSFLTYRYGVKIKEKMIRFRRYLREFGSNTVVTIRDLQSAVGISKEDVLKDIYEFISKDYFKQARIVESDEVLILDKRTYDEYKTYYLDNKKEVVKKETVKTEKEIINTKNEFIAKLISYENSIDGSIVEKIKTISEINKKIFKELKEEDAIYQKLTEYYLPTTIKLLDEYENLSKSKHLENSKIAIEEIEESIDILVEAYEKILNRIYENNVIDVKTDISVLKKILSRDGLLDKENVNG